VTTLEWSVFCPECGMLVEHLTAAKSNSLAEKHTKQTGHATHQTGVPVPTR